MPIAIITGIAGQDGSYLAELLLSKYYIVYGMVRRSSHMTNIDRLQSIRNHPNLHIMYGDVTDISSVMHIITMAQKNLLDLEQLEIYNLAAQSHVKVSFDTPIYTTQTDAIGVLNLLEAVVQLNMQQKVRIYQASTSELYGCTPAPQNETSLMQPQSPYAVSKLYAFWITKNYRDIHKMFIVNGILFNHESERRAENFVTRKITKHVAMVSNGSNEVLHLGNLYASRDWGYAKDFVNGMWLMLQHDKSDDYVIATGEQHTVKEFVENAFEHIGIQVRWEGEGMEERGFDKITNQLLVKVDPTYFRPTEVDSLQGDATKAFTEIGWKPTTSFKELVKIMISHDISKLTR